jgi:hypothetical protein
VLFFVGGILVTITAVRMFEHVAWRLETRRGYASDRAGEKYRRYVETEEIPDDSHQRTLRRGALANEAPQLCGAEPQDPAPPMGQMQRLFRRQRLPRTARPQASKHLGERVRPVMHRLGVLSKQSSPPPTGRAS